MCDIYIQRYTPIRSGPEIFSSYQDNIVNQIISYQGSFEELCAHEEAPAREQGSTHKAAGAGSQLPVGER